MTFRYSKAAWAVKRLTHAEKVVLVRLAWYADSGDADEAYPSVATLAADCCMSPRGVQKILRTLEPATLETEQKNLRRHGLIELVKAGGGKTSSRYRLRLNAATPESSSPLNDVHSRTTFTPEPCSAVNQVRRTPAPCSGDTTDETIPPRTPTASLPPKTAAAAEPLELEVVEPSGRSLPRRDRSDRGARLPDDWALPDDWRRWAVEKAKGMASPSISISKRRNLRITGKQRQAKMDGNAIGKPPGVIGPSDPSNARQLTGIAAGTDAGKALTLRPADAALLQQLTPSGRVVTHRPACATDEALDRLALFVERSLGPIGPKGCAVLLDRLFAVLPLPAAAEGPPDRLEIYIDILKEFPADVLARAIDAVIRQHRWATTPTIGDIVAHCEEDPEYRQRLGRQGSIRCLRHLPAPLVELEPTPEERVLEAAKKQAILDAYARNRYQPIDELVKATTAALTASSKKAS